MNIIGGPWHYVGAFHQATELVTIKMHNEPDRKYYYCVKCREWHLV